MADKKTYCSLLAALIMPGAVLIAQEKSLSLGPWHLQTVSGEVGIEGLYLDQNTVYNEIEDSQSSTYAVGGLKLNTSSYFWRPDIISVNLNGEYNPESRNEKYLSIPDRSEVRTLKKLDLRTTVFSDRNLNLSTWINLDQSYFNRENITNVKSDNKQWGGLFNLNNSIVPLSLRFMSLDWKQIETESERTFRMRQNSFQSRFTKSFFGSDKHDLSYSYDNYEYIYSDQNRIANEVNRVNLNNNIFFDANRKIGFRSHIIYYNQNGNHSFTKLDASENLYFRLPHHLDLRCGYNFYRMEDQYQLLNIKRINTSLKHKLYESLTSEVFAEYSSTSHTIYTESEFKSGAELRYTKKIPIGTLNLGYRYFRHHNTTDSESGIVNIVNESHLLNDIAGIYLKKPYVEQFSLLVTDNTGTIIYEEGLDYLTNSINDFTVIFRIPGGQIEQDQEVLVSYSAIQPGTYHYEANNHSFNAGISMFKRLLEVYYRGGIQNFENVEAAEFLTLNEFNQNVIGGKFYLNFLTGGVEYDLYNSSLIPYKSINYFLNVNVKINAKILFSANGTLRDYLLLDSDVNQKYTNLSGRISYSLSRSSKLNFQIAYLSQKGKNIDLDLLTGRIDFVTNYRKMYFKTGVTLYNRSYTNSTFTYTRSFIQLTRKF